LNRTEILLLLSSN